MTDVYLLSLNSTVVHACLFTANWVILTYNSGDQYDHHCIGQDGKKENRRAKIMFICDPALTVSRFV